MPDTKISALSDGVTAQDTDLLGAARGVGNVRLSVAQIKAAVSGAGEYATFAALLAATGSLTVGRVYTVLGAICTGGAYGTRWVWDGTLLRPAGGQVLVALSTQTDGASGGTTAEQILWSVLFPAGVFAGARTIRLRQSGIASGTDTNARTARWRFGTAGTDSDAIIANSNLSVSNSTRQYGFGQVSIVVSSTAVRGIPFNNTPGNLSPDSWVVSGTANAADVTVPNLASSALYVSASIQQGASPSATMSLTAASVYVE